MIICFEQIPVSNKIESGLIYFTEEPSKEYMMIPTTRIVRIIKHKDGGC